MPIHGVYRGNNSSGLAAFETFLGRQVSGVTLFTAWTAANPGGRDPGWLLAGSGMGNAGREGLWSIEAWLYDAGDTGTNAMRDCANGSLWNEHRTWATKILNSRSGDSRPIFVRTAWELGGPWFAWTKNAQADNTAFRNAFKQFHDAFKSISGRFRIVWDIAGDYGAQEHLYPGDNCVDVISQDVYYQSRFTGSDPAASFRNMVLGQGNYTRGLQWCYDFAQQHGKLFAIPEWGIQYPSPGAEFIRLLRDWIRTRNIEYVAYWDAEGGIPCTISGFRDATVSNAYKTHFYDMVPGTTTPPPPTVDTTPKTFSLGTGADALVLKITQDPYLAAAQYTVSVDSAQIGGTQTAGAQRGSGQQDTVTVLGNWAAGDHTVSINFLNDEYGGSATTDRNLYLESATYNGTAVSGASLNLGPAGPQTFTFNEPPPPPAPDAPVTLTVGSGGDVLILKISQDHYVASAQYTVSVDGVQIGGTLTASGPHSAPVSLPPQNTFYEDFSSNTIGQLSHKWGDPSVTNGVVRIGGTGGIMTFPGGANTCFGNGLFEIRARLDGANIGSGSGPALVLWPADDKWTAVNVENAGGTFPYHLSREIDIGEINGNGETYVAAHYTDCSWGRSDCDAYVAFTVNNVISGFNQRDFHTYAARLETDKITFLVDNQVIGIETAHPAPDYANGGVNHTLGVMNGSPETAVEADWVRWTPAGASATPGASETKSDTITVLGNWGAGTHTVSINYTNDYSDAGGDRNLYLDGATFNGAAVPSSAISFPTGGAKTFSFTKATAGTGAFVKAATANVKNGPGPLTVTLPSVAAGNTLVVGVSLWELSGDGVPNGVSSSPAVAFTNRIATADMDAGGNAECGSIWTGVAASAGSHTITVTVAGTSSGSMTVAEFTGIDAAAPVDRTVAATGNSATASTGTTAATTVAEAVAVALATVDTGAVANGGITVPAGYTNLGGNPGAAAGLGHSLDFRGLTATGAQSASWTLGAAYRWGGALAVLKKAAPPAPPPDPVTATIGTGADRLVLKISQDYYQGSAQYTVSVDGTQIGGTQTAGASRGLGTDTITVQGDWAPGQHSCVVAYLNDLGGAAGADRNLYLESATYNGLAVTGAAFTLSTNGSNSFTFTEPAPVVRTPTQTTVGTGPDRLVLQIAQDYHLGSAQYTVSVDGTQIGPTLTASADKSSGQWDTVTVLGTWAVGNHTASVNFTNDASDATGNRNLYVVGATYNDVAVPSSALTLGTAGAQSFAFTEAAPPPPTGSGQNTEGVALRAGSGVLLITAAGKPMLGAGPNSSVSGGTPPPPPPPTIQLSPLNPPALTETVAGQGAAASFTVTSVGITSFSWVIVNNDTGATWRTQPVAVATSGTAVFSATFRANGEFVKVYETGNLGLYVDSGRVSLTLASGGGGGGPAASAMNIFIRGQSNALLFTDYQGAARMANNLSAGIGKPVNIIASWGRGDGNNTINSGTAYWDWRNDGKLDGLIRYIQGLSNEQRALPTIIFWMHNESDQGYFEWNDANYEEAVRADAVRVRQAFGQGAETVPYFFVPIRYPYGSNWPPLINTYNKLADDGPFNAGVSFWVVENTAMDGGPEAGNNSSHLSSNDALNSGSALAEIIQQALPDLIPSLGTGGGGTTPPPPSIALSPVTPPALTETAAGQGASTNFTVTSANMGAFSWVVVRPDGSWRTNPVSVTTSGSVAITVNFRASGEYAMVYKSDDAAVYAVSDPVTLTLASGGGGGTDPPPATGGEFNMATARKGWPGSNNQFEYFGTDREWAHNHVHPTQGFAGIRWQPTWKRADGFYGSWEPAEGEVYRIHRKGASGQDAQTLVFTCGPNPAPVPAGEKCVVWQVPGWDGGVERNSSMNLSGYNLPLRQKLTVLRSTGSANWDPNGRRIIELDMGTALPAIDHYPGQIDNGAQNMRIRHWSFWRNAAAHEHRHPIGWFTDLSKNQVVANGGYIMLGGLQGQPVWYDWTLDHRNFGSIVEELWRSECEGLAYSMGDTDPAKLAVELENEPTREWGFSNDAGAGGVGYGQLLADVWYPIAREVWGPSRTLVVKSGGFGGLDSLRSEFNWTNPAGHRTHLVTHNYDGQAHFNADGSGGMMNFSNIGDTDFYAERVKEKITQFGFIGGGMTEYGIRPYEWWNYDEKIGDAEQGRRIGRMTTSMANRDMYVFGWTMVGDDNASTYVYNIDGHNIEAYNPGLRPYCNRAGVTTT